MSKSHSDIFEASFKIEHGDGIFAYFIYRPIVYILMRTIFAKHYVSPNKLTVVSLLLYISAGLSLIVAYLTAGISFWLLKILIDIVTPIRRILLSQFLCCPLSLMLFLIAYNLALVVDCLDGSVARYYKASSYTGRLLDSFSDSFGHIIILMGLIFFLPNYAFLISSFYLAYYSLVIVHLSFKFEQLKMGVAEKGEVKGLFRVGPLKILVGTLDYFVMSNNLIIITYILLPKFLESILLLINLFWFGLLIGYVIIVYRGYKIVE